jgi:amidase
MTELLFGSAVEAANLIRTRRISALDLTEMAIARIEAANPKINAVVELRGDAARGEARAADAAITRGDPIGPLHGVPITIKEAIPISGMRSTWGNADFRDHVAEGDATVVQRLMGAGAIVIGTTNVAAMLGDFAQTANEVYGVTNNPWDASRTPGGSSGGAAAAVAAGMTFLDLGSDLVGSIRIPASFCGVYGIKPSADIVPLTGFQPPGPPSVPFEFTYRSSLGPFARSAGDLRSALRLIAGPEMPAAAAFSWTLPSPRRDRLSDFRVGVVLDAERAAISSEVGAPLSAVVDELRRIGVQVIDGWPEGIDPAAEAETFGFHVGMFFAAQDPGAEPPPMTEFIEQERRRMAARAAWARYFEDVDVFVCPTNFTAAFPYDSRPFEERTVSTPEGERRYDEQPFWISHASITGLPAVVAPIGRTDQGLPVGAQIIGPLFEDDTPLTFAELLADLIGGYESPPIG